MDRGAVKAYIKRKYKVEPDFPFSAEYYETAVFRHMDTRKWFALCMKVRADRLGYESDTEWIDVVTMKSEPMLIDGIISREGFHRAYHMNKSQWLTVELGGKVDDAEIKNLIDLSFELTGKKEKGEKNKNLAVSCEGAVLKEGRRFPADAGETELKMWEEGV